MEYQVTITKRFKSKREATDYIHFLEVDEAVLRREGENWIVLYNTSRTTIILEDKDTKVVEV